MLGEVLNKGIGPLNHWFKLSLDQHKWGECQPCRQRLSVCRRSSWAQITVQDIPRGAVWHYLCPYRVCDVATPGGTPSLQGFLHRSTCGVSLLAQESCGTTSTRTRALAPGSTRSSRISMYVALDDPQDQEKDDVEWPNFLWDLYVNNKKTKIIVEIMTMTMNCT